MSVSAPWRVSSMRELFRISATTSSTLNGKSAGDDSTCRSDMHGVPVARKSASIIHT